MLTIEGITVTATGSGSWRRATSVTIVPNLSLTVAAGESLAIVGESGSGKSTLLRAILGLAPVSAGRIMVGGTSLASGTSRERLALRALIGVVFQDTVGALSPRLSIGNIVEEPLRIHRRPRPPSLAANILARVGLPADLAQRYPHQLSGGQARRVGVARALALSPRLLLADEPTAGLDVSVQGEILNLLLDLQVELGLTTIMVTHNLPVVRQFADRVGVLYLGHMVELAPTSVLFSAPRHPYTAMLLAADLGPGDRVTPGHRFIAGDVPSLRSRPTGCPFHPRCARVTDLCRSTMPQLSGGDHQVACHNPLSQ